MNSDRIETTGDPGEPVGLFYSWWRDDAVPVLSSPSEMTVTSTREPERIQTVTGLESDEIASRLQQGNTLFIAQIDDDTVGYGWSAGGGFAIGELGVSVDLPAGNRYLWDFFTDPRWRGKNIYPALLQAILASDRDADRFWVGHDLDNVASGRGIIKAGFTPIGEVYFPNRDSPVFVRLPGAPATRARAAAELLGMPLWDSLEDSR